MTFDHVRSTFYLFIVIALFEISAVVSCSLKFSLFIDIPLEIKNILRVIENEKMLVTLTKYDVK